MLVAAARRISPVLLSLAAKSTPASAFFSLQTYTTPAPPSRKLNSVSTSGSVGTATMAKEKFTVAACQILCGEEKEDNIAKAEQAVKDAAAAGAQVSM